MSPLREHLQVASLLATAYIVCALTLSGIPGWSELTSLFLALLLVLSVADAARGRLTVAKWVSAPAAFLGICILWSILNWEKATTPLLSTMAAWIGALIIAIRVQNGLPVHVVLRAMIAASAINAVAVLVGFDAYLLYQADFRDASEEVLARRSSGLVGNSNALAIQALLPLFAIALWKEGIGRATWSVGIMCAVYVLAVSGSRKGLYLAVLAVPYVAYALQSPRSRNALLTVSIGAIAVLMAILVGGDSDFLPAWLQELEVLKRVALALAGVDTSVLHRRELVDSGIEAFLRSPLFGYGLDAFRWVAGSGYYAHNNFVELAVNGGLIMIGSYYSLYILSAVRASRAYGMSSRNRFLHWALLAVMLVLELSFVSYSSKFFILLLMLLTMVPATSRTRKVGHLDSDAACGTIVSRRSSKASHATLSSDRP